MSLKHHQILLELLQLRETNHELFLDKFYDAIIGEFNKVFMEELIKDKAHQQTLKLMINHFEIKEEYEKCEKLLEFLNLVNKGFI